MKYSYYLPLISQETGSRFVFCGSYTENEDGTIADALDALEGGIQ